MIRIVSTVSLLALLAIVLYLPAAHPPERFVRQVRVEHALNTALWGREPALRLLSRTLDLHAERQQSSPLPRTFTESPAAPQVDAAVAAQLGHVAAHLVDNPYTRSLDALLALATYRFVILTEWLPVLLVFVFAVIADGVMIRIVKSKEFVQHNPEHFALQASLAILVACATVLACVLPLTVPPAVLVCAPAVIGVCVGGAVASYHFHG